MSRAHARRARGPRTVRVRGPVALLAVLAMSLGVGLLTAPVAHAQSATPSRLVSNLNQSTAGFAVWRTGWSYAQEFTTGSLAEGYEDWVVSGVELFITDQNGGDQGTPTTRVSIREASGGAPGDTVAGSLEPPEGLGAGIRTVTASGDRVRLQAETSYFVVVEVTAEGGGLGLWATPSDGEDDGASEGWSIGDVYSYQRPGESWLQNCCNSFKVAVTGYARETPPFVPPEAVDQNNIPIDRSAACRELWRQAKAAYPYGTVITHCE